MAVKAKVSKSDSQQVSKPVDQVASKPVKKTVKKVAPKKVEVPVVEVPVAEVPVATPVVAETKEVVEVKAELVAEVAGIPTLKEMLEAGSHFGHVVRRWNPKMKPYIYAEKNGIHIIDLFQTRANLIKACNYLEETVKSGKKIVLVGTKGQASELIRTEAIRMGVPYITTRWVGGLFTNWEQIRARINKLVDMRKKYEAGEYKKYTKKEQVDLKKTIDRLDRMYGGMVSLDALPSVMFVVDPSREITAVREAQARNIAIVAIADTNCDPTGIAHIIPANDDALKSVTLLVTSILASIERGLAKMTKPVAR